MRVKGAVMSRYWMGLLGILMLVVYLRGQEPLSKGDYLGATTLRRGTPEWDEIEESLSGQVPKQVLQMHSENQRIMPKGMDTTDFPLKLERINWIERKSAKHLVLVAFSDRMGAKLVVYEPITSKDFVPVWVSSETLDQGLGRIQVEDINQDEKPEIMAYTAKGAHSLALYLYTWDGLSAKLMNPNGDTSRAFFQATLQE